MNSEYVYALVLLGAVLVPFLASFHPKLRFDHYFGAFFKANIVVSILFVIWDIIFTHLKVWGFSEQYTLGYRIQGLPIEEILFFIIIPFCCLFSYQALRKLTTVHRKMPVQIISSVLVIGLLAGAVVYIDRWYPMVTFFATALLIFYLGYIKRPGWLGLYYFTYAIMIIPFFIVNGMLTGWGLEQPVVWYNEAEIIGVRMGTIPLEDSFYGLLMVGCNILLFEKFNRAIDSY